MRATVTISLTKETRKELDSLAHRKEINRSALIQEAIKRYLFEEGLREIRKRAVPRAKAHGIYSDEDIFRIVS